MLTFVPISRNKLRGIILMCLKLQGLCTSQAVALFQLVAHRVRTKSHPYHLVCLTHRHSNAVRTARAVAVQNLPQEKLRALGPSVEILTPLKSRGVLQLILTGRKQRIQEAEQSQARGACLPPRCFLCDQDGVPVPP